MKTLQALLALFACAFLPLHAASLDDLTYTTTDRAVTITDCDEAATGELIIPAIIEGKPVTSIGYESFKGCGKLTRVTIPDGVTSIEEEAFHYCSSLTSITIPDSVNSIGDAAFGGCTSMTKIEVGVENVNYANVSGVLFNKDKTLLHTYPAGKAGANYVIPDSVTSIGNGAFTECISLTSITIPDSVTSIGQYAFRRCSRMTNITIGNGVTSIGGGAFAFCESLTSITIPDGVTSIGNGVFYVCTSLISITIPDSVTSIGNGAFTDCISLTTIEVGAENVNYADVNGVLFNKEKTLLHTYPAGKTGANYVVPDSVTNIGGGAFFEGTSLTSITIPDSVTSIGEAAFHNCSSLTSITIGDGVTSIGDRAFYKCTSLTSITIPDSVTSIGSDAFKDSTATITVKKDTQIAQLEAQLAQMTAERDARPTQAAYDVVVAERDAILSDIQLAYDEVTAAAGGAEADLVVEIVDPANAPLDTRNGGVVAQALEAFEVNTFASPANLDTEMVLYDSAGTLITTNDDAPSAARPEGAGDLLSQLNFPDGLAGGVYYLAVGTYNSIFNSDFAVSSNGQGGEYTLTLPSGPFSGALEASGIDWYRIEIGTNFAALQLQPLTELYRNLVEANASAISERDARPTQTAYDTAVAESRTAGRSDVTSTPASYNLTTTESYNAVVTQRDARFIDTDKDGITDVKEAELETDSAEETVFYLQGAYDSAVAASRLAGRGDVTADPPTFALTTLAAYNGMIVQKDITITTLTTTVGEKNALIVQKDNQYNALEEQRVAEAQQLNGIIETRNNTISSNTATIGSLNETIAQKDTAYATVVAERDARPTQEQCDTNATEARLAGRNDVTTSPAAYQLISISTYNTAVAERDARPTQAAYDTVVTERDARPTQTSYNTVVAERNARPTEEAYNALIAERDARPTIEEVKDARLGSVVLQSDVANQSVKIRFSVEETDDFRTWTKRDEINEITVPLEVGKRFYRFALEDE